MVELTLSAPGKYPLRPIVEAALANELRVLNAGIQKTRQRLKIFETRYQWSTDEFLHRYEQDELDETLDFAEWIGEYRLLNRLQEKAETLQGVRFAN